MTKNQKKSLIRILVSGVLYVAALLIEHFEIVQDYRLIFVFLPAYLLIGYDVLLSAVKGIVKGQLFDENFLMALATIGAFIIGEYPESVAVMMFYQVGQLFESYAVGKSRESITQLMDIRPDYANINKDGKLVQVDPYDIKIGDHIVVTAGEKIPLDGKVIDGTSSVDTSALTGESLPRTLKLGDDAISGCVNLNGVLTIEVTKEFGESTVSQILDLVENATNKKASAENFITKFARYYTPIVVFAAAALTVIPIIFMDKSFYDTVRPALNFLVVSCPCALVISVPLSFFGGIGGASKVGILIKGSNYMEVLAKTKTVVLDKTGTLTEGIFKVTTIKPNGDWSSDQLLENAAIAETLSNHPIAISTKEAYGKELSTDIITDFTDIPGHGLKVVVGNDDIYAGNAKLMKSIPVDYEIPSEVGTVVHVAKNKEYLGYIIISDQIKKESSAAIKGLNDKNIKTIMLTGDAQKVGESVANSLGLDAYYAELLPSDKVDKLEEIMLSKQNPKDTVVFVGDGINDAPVLARADVGISMGALGSDAAIEASDIVLMDDNPSKISLAINISKKTIGIVKQNIIFALGIKILVMILSIFGVANMWQAVFADVGVSVIAILNAMRLLSPPKE